MQSLYMVYLYNHGGKGWVQVSGRPARWSQIAYISDSLKACEEFMEDWVCDAANLHITLELSGPSMGEYIGYVSGQRELGAVFRATIQLIDVTHLLFNPSPTRFLSLPLV